MKQLLLVLTLIFSLSANSFKQLEEEPTEDTLRLYKPTVTASLSLLPGGGQFYTRHFTKGGIFLATELLMGTQAYNYWTSFHDAYKPYYAQKAIYDSLHTEYLNTPSSLIKPEQTNTLTSARNRRDLTEYDIERTRIDYINYSAWFTGIYLWNIVDAIGASNQYPGASNPDPRRAAALSAIPFTGAGQFYNGSWFKGAMVSVVEIGCMVTAINFQRLMNDGNEYEKNLRALPDSSFHKIPLAEQLQWENRFDDASTSRTMFMWYGVFFYLYGIADAMVDAHMHGFDRNFHIAGAIDPIEGKMNFAFSTEFGNWRD